MSRRALTLVLALALTGTGAVTSAAAAADQDQELVLTGVDPARAPGDRWSPPPIRTGAPALHLAIDPDDAGVCELTSDAASVDFTHVGTCHVTAYAPAYTGYKQSPDEPVTFTVTGHPTVATLTATPPTPDVGDEITLTAVVDSAGTGQPTGDVEFRRGATLVATEPLEGDDPADDFATAVATLDAPESGTLSYVATYVPDEPTVWAGDVSDPASVDASRRDVTVTATPSAAAVAEDDPLTLDITAKDGSADVDPSVEPATLGTVTVDGDPVPVSWVHGRTTVTLPTDEVGHHEVAVSFQPDDQVTYAVPAAAPATYDVGAVTTTSLEVVPIDPLVGDEVLLTATVDSGGLDAPEGEVEFLRKGAGGSYSVLDAPVALSADVEDPAGDTATAELRVEAENATARLYAARFVPDAPAVLAASRSLDRTVTPVQRSVDVAVDVPTTPVLLGNDVTIEVTATHGTAKTPVPGAATSSVTVDGTPVTGLDWSTGTDEILLEDPTAGTHTVVVTYLPADTDRYRTPDAVTEHVDITIPTTTTLSTAPTGVLVGAPATFTATVTSTGHGQPLGDLLLQRQGSGGTWTTVDQQTPTLETGSTDTATTTLTTTPANATPTTYRTVFVPTDPTDFHTSTSTGRTLTAVRRGVDVRVTVPTVDVATNAAVTVTVAATHGTGATPVDAGAGTTVTFDGATVPDLEWTDGAASFQVTPTTTGSHSVRVTFKPRDTDRYEDPAAVTGTFVAKHAQPIRWGAADAPPPASVIVDGTWDSKVLGGASGNAVTLGSLTPTVCSVSGTVVTMLAAAGSTCRVRATQAGGTTYLPGTRDAAIDVTPRPVSVRVSWPASGATYLKEVVVTATALDTTSDAPVPDVGPGAAASQRSGTGTIVVDGVAHPVVFTRGVAQLPITPDDVDDITLSATFVPNRADAYAPVPEPARVLQVGKADQQVLVARTPEPVSPNIGDTWQPHVASGGSSEDVLVDTTTPDQCTVRNAAAGDTRGPIVTFDALDVCVVRFRQPGGRHYNDATPVLVPVTVVKLGVAVAITGQDDARAYGDDVTLRFAATATKSPHGTVPGRVTVTVTDRTTHAAVSTAGLLTVNESAGTAVLTLGDALLAGTYDVRADFTASRDDLYSTTFATDDFTVTLAEQTVSLEPGTSAPTAVRVGSDDWEPDFADTDAGTDVVLTRLDTPSLAEPQAEYEDEPGWAPPTWSCDLAGGTVAFVSQGDCVLRAVAPGSPRRYADSDPVDYTVEVSRVPVTLSLTATPDEDVVVGDEVRIKATAKVGAQAARGHGPLTVTGETTVPDPAQAWFGGGRFHSFSPAHAGSYDIETWFHPEDPVTYQNVKKEVRVEVGKGSQEPALVGEQPTSVLVGDRWTPETEGGGSANPVVVEVDETATDLLTTVDPDAPGPVDPEDLVCRVVGDDVLFVGHGDCQLVLTQAGDHDYEKGEKELALITISQTTTTVTLVAPTRPRVGVPYTVAARVVGGAAATPVVGGGPIVVSIDGVEVARVDDEWEDGVRSLTFVPTRVGPLVATAAFTPDDDAAYAGADDELTDVVDPGTQSVLIGLEPPTTAYVDGTWSPRVTGRGAPGAVASLTSATQAVCSVTGDTVTFRAPGSCSVTAAMAAVTAYGRTTWTGDAQTRTFTVHGHPTTVAVTQPFSAQRLVARPIDVRAQVSGRPNGAGTPVNVSGTVQFTVDDLPRGAPVTVTSTGLATARITVPVDPAVRTTRDHDFGAVFVPDDARYWARGDAPDLLVPIALNAQEIQYGAATSPLYIGQTWTPQVSIAPAEALPPVVTRDPDDADICSYTGGVVTFDAVAPDDSTCNLDYTQPGDGEWAPASDQGQGIEVQRRPTTVSLSVGAERTVTRPVSLSATVLAEAVAPTSSPLTTGLGAVAPAGSVRFAAGGSTLAVVPVVLDPDDATKPGTASATYEPGRAGAVEITATFEPSDDALFAEGDDEEPITVAKAPTTTTITAVTGSQLTALVVPQLEPDSPLGGSVAFSYTVVGSSVAMPLGTVDVGDDRRAVLTGSVPPADQDVVLRADYLGDADYATSRGLRDRHLPIVTPHVDGKLSGWNGGPVTVRFTCDPHPLGGGAIVSCPTPVTLRGDGRGQSVSRAGTAADGGRATATVTGLDIDDTPPTVRVGGTVAGASYRGTAPAATCLGSDALSKLTSCTVTRTQLAGRAVRDTAVAIDNAGNRAKAQITYEVRQEWVVDAPLVRGGYQVKPGTTQRIIVRTEGAQPQLMLPGAKRALVPGKVFSAARIDNGIVTWFVDLKLPKSLRAGQRYLPGFRLSDAPAQVIRLRLDVVKKPAGKKPAGTKHRRHP